jgi:lipoprotein-anchoring transpeptidase ErfK/SrfK
MWTRIALILACALAAPHALAREVVPYRGDLKPGTILIRTAERTLDLIQDDGTALRYPVAVGRPGKQWTGEARIQGKYVRPAWAPPAEIRRDNPRLPRVIAAGSPRNPMGARALVLDRDEYAIHGTNRPDSIGTPASYGCIRMLNADVVDLYDRVRVGTRVVVTE